MSTKIILTADDYGVVPDINQGVIDLVNLGVLNSVEIFPNYGPQGSDSLRNAHKLIEETKNSGNSFEIGAHLTITSGKPIEKTPGLATILQPSGEFKSYRDIPSSADGIALYNELEKQLKVLLDDPIIGPKVTHITNHHDTLWFYPNYTEELIKLANKYNLAIRNPNSIPKSKGWIYYVLQNMIRKISKSDKKRIQNAHKARKRGKFIGKSVTFKSTTYMNSKHYGTLDLSGHTPVDQLSTEVFKKRNKLNRMFKRALRDDAEVVEFMFHVRKGDESNLHDWRGKTDVEYYTGINPKYFDGRVVEYQSLKKNQNNIRNMFASSDYDSGSWDRHSVIIHLYEK